MFCEVERSYIEDGFNLYGLRACVSNFSDCLDLILDRFGPDDDSDDSQLTQSACTLYGLIHARYILTAHGLDAMYAKVRLKQSRFFIFLIDVFFQPLIAEQYAAKEFGTCPLVRCGGQPVLPVSLKDEIRAGPVKIYCPKCCQVYNPPPARSRSGLSTGVDGAAFGTTFPHLFLMTFSNLVPDPLPVDSSYIPRVFGFRLHKSARQKYSQGQAQQQQQQQQAEPSPVKPQALPVESRPETPRTNDQPSNNSSNQEQATEEKRSRRRKRDSEQPKKEAESKNDGSNEVTIKKRRRNNNTT